MLPDWLALTAVHGCEKPPDDICHAGEMTVMALRRGKGRREIGVIQQCVEHVQKRLYLPGLSTSREEGAKLTEPTQEPNRPNRTEPHPTEPNQTRPNQTEANKTEPSRTIDADHIDADHIHAVRIRPRRTEPNWTEPDRTEPDRTKPNRTETK